MTFFFGQGEGGQNFPDLGGGSEFSRTKFSRFCWEGEEFLGLSFPDLGVLLSRFGSF